MHQMMPLCTAINVNWQRQGQAVWHSFRMPASLMSCSCMGSHRAGRCVLENVRLRVEAFDYLQLPFDIQEGSIQELQLQVR